MAVSLTEGAIMQMCGGSCPDDLKPVLQVIDLKLVQSQQHSATERYRLVLSDGSFYQQGMLATQKNDLVRDGALQKGSVVRLTQFICNSVQNRKIIIIVDLDVVHNKCELIGEPAAAPKDPSSESAAGQSGVTSGNPQSLNSSSHTGGMASRPNAAGQSPVHPKVNPPPSNVYSGISNSGTSYASNAPPTHPKVDPGVSLPRSAPFSGSYGDQNTGFHNPQSEASRPLQNSYARPPQPMYRQPSPMYINRGPIGRNDAPPRIIPIAALNPYQNMWTIKARVTAKGELRHYNNARGEGKVFSFDLLDSDGGEIRATCFNTVADQFYNLIEAGKVYLVSRGSIKPAQKNFNHLHNDQEITLDMTSTIQPCHDDDNSIPKQTFNFRPISEIESVENNTILDVIGVVCSISPTASIMRKNGTETQKRTLQLKDMSGRSVELTLWGNFCNGEGQELQNICDAGKFPVLATKAVRVNDFNGKSIGTIAISQLFVEPDFPEAYTLKRWFENEGKNVPTHSISREISNIGKTDVCKTISQIKDEKLGTSEKPDWISVNATVSFIKSENFCYPGCPIMIGDRQCNKKVTNNGDGKWHCDRCNQSIDACDYRYILSFQIMDHTGVTWVTAFQESGEEIMGIPAKDLYYLKYEEQDDENFSKIIQKVLFADYVFKLKVKEETFSDEQRVKSTVVKADKVDYVSKSRVRLDLIHKLLTEKSEGTTLPNNTGLGNLKTGQVMPPAYNPIKSNTNTSRDFGMPTSQAGQHYGSQYSNFSAAGSPGSYTSCTNCGGSGHSSAHCPNVRNLPGQSAGGGFTNTSSVGSRGGGSVECFKCHQTGHWARDCPGLSAVPPYGSTNVMQESFPIPGGGGSGECFKCHQPGHWARDCPGVSAAPSSYGSTNVMQGRYGVAQKQQFGGY
ncbi:hypothetical protein VNO78_08712 [Psophocarpus tetragonolobus]|uniref:Replication protein A subunit n=1 Tax=Psophocarpus tetragonolobus TaxID=3891 RepID=A0AAN9SXL3_PSOTE